MDTVERTSGEERAIQAIERLEAYTVVDTDVHEINVDIEAYSRYMDEPYASRMKHIANTDEPLTQGPIGTLPVDLEPRDKGFDDEVRTTSPEGIQAFMDRFNTDYAILHGHQMEGISGLPERDFAVALSSAYNDYVLDNFVDDYDGLKGMIRVAQQAPKRAAEEIDRMAGESEMVGVHLSLNQNEVMGDRKFDPIFEAAADHGLPIDYHIGGSANMPWAGKWGGPELQSSLEDVTAANQHIMSNIVSMIFNGVPERYPDLHHVFVEGGVTWLPWLMGRMDKNYNRRKHALPWLARKPSEYLLDNFSFTSQPLEDTAGTSNLRAIFEMFDAKHTLMYATDVPHWNFDYPSVLTIPKLSEETERRIFGENALEVYRI